MPHPSPNPDLLTPLAALVVKDGVGLGRLTDSARALALGFVWAGLSRMPMNERAVNEALKSQLAGAAVFLGTDHVELRRWLCDAGWVARDGFGREYRRVSTPHLPPVQRALGAALEAAFDGGDTAAYAAARREQRSAEREARRRSAGAGAGLGHRGGSFAAGG
jgi:hypothetical protein